jgi:hypothetical protein
MHQVRRIHADHGKIDIRSFGVIISPDAWWWPLPIGETNHIVFALTFAL